MTTAREEPLLKPLGDDLIMQTLVEAVQDDLLVQPSSWMSRTFGKGSLWGTVFNLCAATLGAGALSLPHAIAAMGLVPGLVLLTITAFATHYSIVLLVSCLAVTNARSFEDLSVSLFGKRTGFLVEASIIVFCFGTCIAYTVAVGDIINPFLSDSTPDWLSRKLVMVFFWAGLMLPLSFVDKMSSLQCTSLFGIMALGYLVLAVTVHFLADASVSPQQTVDKVSMAHFSENAVSASAILMFAFTCQVNVPSLYYELSQRTPGQMRAVSKRGVAICMLCYLVIGFSGYANFPDSQQGNVLKNYCVLDATKSSFADDPPRVMAPAFGAITLTVLMAYPVNLYPCRYALDVLCFPHWGDSYAFSRRVGLTLGIAALSLVIALVVPDISVVFQLMGGTASAYVCFIMPAAFAWKLRESVPQMRTPGGRAACIALFLVGLLIGVLSTATTIAGTPAPLTRKRREPPHAQAARACCCCARSPTAPCTRDWSGLAARVGIFEDSPPDLDACDANMTSSR